MPIVSLDSSWCMITQILHGTGVFTYISHTCKPNVGKYPSPMESQRAYTFVGYLHVVALLLPKRSWQDGGGTASGLATVVVGAGGAFIREETSCGAGFGRCSTGEPRCRKTSGNWGEPGRELGDMVGSWLGWR